MNKRQIDDEVERLCRITGIDGYEEYLDGWENRAHEEICHIFEVPSLKISETRNSSQGLDEHMFPYEYDGTDVSIYYDGQRIDYQPEPALDLGFSRRRGNQGRVKKYDWSGVLRNSSHLRLASTNTIVQAGQGVVLENRSPIIRAVGHFSFVAAHAGEWCRFAPFNPDSDGEAQSDPGDHGYRIQEVGTDDIGNYARLEEPYRGPDSTAALPAPISIRPMETQTFRMYQVPDESGDDIEVKCWRRPRPLYNDEDVPEWPAMGIAVTKLTISVGLKHLGRYDEAATWEADAYRCLEMRKRRRRSVETSSPDVPESRIIGRSTSLRSVFRGRYGRMR